jgi:hypothetical protein
MTYALAEAVLDTAVHNPVARPSGALQIKIAPGMHPQDALTHALAQARNAVLTAMCSGDARQVADAQEFLTEVEAAAKRYLDAYKVCERVEKAWVRHA